MGTWPIYKKHFLQLILTKTKLSFDKISPRDFYFCPFFSICTCIVNVFVIYSLNQVYGASKSVSGFNKLLRTLWTATLTQWEDILPIMID